jgi:thiamine-monophosphate kinase
MTMDDEFAKIEWLKKRFELAREARADASEIIVGIGDDAAVIDFGSRATVVTVDTQVEDVHFRRPWISCHALGIRSTIAAASDVWAMGALPHAAVVALTLPDRLADTEFRDLIEGIADASSRTGARIVGGNLSRGCSLSITTTVFGIPLEKPVTREGAQPGDQVHVTGALGAAALGLAILEADASHLENAERFISRWRLPPTQGHLVRELARVATAAIDVSDGCLQDLRHLCHASEVGAMIHSHRLPTAEGYSELCAALDVDALELCLTGGDDYELLFTTRKDADIEFPATLIGHVTEGREVQVLAEGRPLFFDQSGFRHFS